MTICLFILTVYLLVIRSLNLANRSVFGHALGDKEGERKRYVRIIPAVNDCRRNDHRMPVNYDGHRAAGLTE